MAIWLHQGVNGPKRKKKDIKNECLLGKNRKKQIAKKRLAYSNREFKEEFKYVYLFLAIWLHQGVNCPKLVHSPVKKFVDENVLIHLKIFLSKLPKFY